MLSFWYSERCSREIKLIICIATCVMIFMAAQVQQLGAIFIGLSLMIGIATHLLRGVQLKIAQDNPYREGFSRLVVFLPLIALICLLGYLPAQDKIALALQCIGFSGIGLFLVSIHAQREKRI